MRRYDVQFRYSIEVSGFIIRLDFGRLEHLAFRVPPHGRPAAQDAMGPFGLQSQGAGYVSKNKNQYFNSSRLSVSSLLLLTILPISSFKSISIIHSTCRCTFPIIHCSLYIIHCPCTLSIVNYPNTLLPTLTIVLPHSTATL